MERRRPEVNIARVLARYAEMQARRTRSPALSSEWRWSRKGWSAQQLGFESPLSAEAAPNAEADEKNARKK
jgi:hypothetical protein